VNGSKVNRYKEIKIKIYIPLQLIPAAIFSLILSTILLRSSEHGGVADELHNPSKRILLIHLRSGGGILTINDRICKIQYIKTNKIK